MDDRVSLNQTTEPTQERVDSGITTEVGRIDDASSMRIADLLEVLPEDRKDISNEIKELSQWAKESTNSEDNLLQLTAIKELRSKLGLSSTGKRLIETLAKFTRLQLHKQTLDNESKRLRLEMNLIKNA